MYIYTYIYIYIYVTPQKSTFLTKLLVFTVFYAYFQLVKSKVTKICSNNSKTIFREIFGEGPLEKNQKTLRKQTNQKTLGKPKKNPEIFGEGPDPQDVWILFSPTAKFAMGSLAQNSSGAIRCSCNTRFRRRFRRVPEGSGADGR